jgi:hypothetical protein
MSLTLNTTVSDTYANSYCDVDFADDYFSNHYSSTLAAQWATLNDDQKTYLLIMACRVIETVRCTIPVALWDEYALLYNRRSRVVIDANLNRTPVKFNFYQKLQFPRNLDLDPNTGLTYVPEDVKMAQCEQAVYLTTYDQTNQTNRMQGVSESMSRIGKLETLTRYGEGVNPTAVAPMAVEFLRPYMVKSSNQLRRA